MSASADFPTAEAHARLLRQWREGCRDREVALHLLFSTWMHWAEPSFLTGLEEGPETVALWKEIYAHFGGASSSDPEFLWVVGIMAGLFPWALGEEGEWERTAAELKRRSQQILPTGMHESRFAGRGEYGTYFAHHARTR